MIHNTENSGFDGGRQRHANDHVDGLNHYQEREAPEEEHQYPTVACEAESPIGIVWEVVDERLRDVSRQRCRRDV